MSINFTSMENLDSVASAIDTSRHGDDFWGHNNQVDRYGTDKKTELVRLATKYLQLPNKDYSFEDLRNDETLSDAEFDDRRKILEYFIDDPPHIVKGDGGDIYISNGLHRAEALRIAQEQTGIDVQLPVETVVSSVKFDSTFSDIDKIDMIQMSAEDYAKLQRYSCNDIKGYDDGVYSHGQTIKDATSVTITPETCHNFSGILYVTQAMNIDVNVSSPEIRNESVDYEKSGKFGVFASRDVCNFINTHSNDILHYISDDLDMDTPSDQQTLQVISGRDGSYNVMFSGIPSSSQARVNSCVRESIMSYVEDTIGDVPIRFDDATKRLTNNDKQQLCSMSDLQTLSRRFQSSLSGESQRINVVDVRHKHSERVRQAENLCPSELVSDSEFQL